MTVGRFASPEDFVVEEIPLYESTGEGGHTFLWVEKRLRNTEEVAKLLARCAGVPSRDVGYAGRKDRSAVTRQSFSVPGVDPEEALAWTLPGVRVLRAARHRHKLRTGQLAGNRFDIRVRELSPATIVSTQDAAVELRRIGLPNRFGTQRFGRDGDNVARGCRLLRKQSVGRDRRAARFLLSAVQAAVFNAALELRCLPLDRLELGDLARKTDTGGLFLVEDLETDNARAGRFEISATGPLFGTRMDRPRGAPEARECEALARLGLTPDDFIRPPRGVTLRGARRPLRVPVGSLRIEPFREHETDAAPNALRLRFDLPAGSYATVLLEDLLGQERDPSR